MLKPEQRKNGIPNDVQNDLPNDADTWKSNSSLYPETTEDQFQAYLRKQLRGHYGQ